MGLDVFFFSKTIEHHKLYMQIILQGFASVLCESKKEANPGKANKMQPKSGGKPGLLDQTWVATKTGKIIKDICFPVSNRYYSIR